MYEIQAKHLAFDPFKSEVCFESFMDKKDKRLSKALQLANQPLDY